MDYDLIDSILKDMGISRRKLAMIADIPVSTLSAAFRRKSKDFSMENVQKIARVLNVEWWKLMGWEEIQKGVYGLPASPEEAERISDLLFSNQSKRVSKAKSLQSDLLNHFDGLNNDGQKEAVKRVGELAEIDRYKK